MRKYSSRIVIRQGEAGCPSELRKTRAMKKYPWTELIQAKHVLRRLLGDLGRDKPSSCFSICDMKYPDEMNRKGLLYAREDCTVERPKPAYYAVQNLAAVFDNQVVRDRDFACDVPADPPLSIYGYRHQPSGKTLVTAWFRSEIPGDDKLEDRRRCRLAQGQLLAAALHRPAHRQSLRDPCFELPTGPSDLPIQQNPLLRFPHLDCRSRCSYIGSLKRSPTMQHILPAILSASLASLVPDIKPASRRHRLAGRTACSRPHFLN